MLLAAVGDTLMVEDPPEGWALDWGSHIRTLRRCHQSTSLIGLPSLGIGVWVSLYKGSKELKRSAKRGTAVTEIIIWLYSKLWLGNKSDFPGTAQINLPKGVLEVGNLVKWELDEACMRKGTFQRLRCRGVHRSFP